MNSNNLEQSIKIERVFLIGTEGGGMSITRRIGESGAKFYYKHSEFDPTDEGLDVYIESEYDSFEEPFELINNKYCWYLLYVITVHDDFKCFVRDKLVERLNNDSVKPDRLGARKYDWEDALKIKLKCNSTTENKSFWKFEVVKR